MNTIILTFIYKEWCIFSADLDHNNHIRKMNLLAVYSKHEHQVAITHAEHIAKHKRYKIEKFFEVS